MILVSFHKKKEVMTKYLYYSLDDKSVARDKMLLHVNSIQAK